MAKLNIIITPASDGLWAEVEHCSGVTWGKDFGELEKNLEDFISENIELMKEDGAAIPALILNNQGYKYRFNLQQYFKELPLKVTSLAEAGQLNRSLLARYANGELTTRKQFDKIVKAVQLIGEQISKLEYS